MVMGEELQEANHYAAELIKDITGDLSGQWENFCCLLQERVGLLEYSVSFHEKLQLVCDVFIGEYFMYVYFLGQFVNVSVVV